MTPRTVRIDGFAVPADGSDEGTLFAAGSISKAVTALVPLKLVHDGVLELDGDGQAHRQLLAHTSGADLEVS
jgi:CubicO group peptidase (beta-lactamase class C family)